MLVAQVSSRKNAYTLKHGHFDADYILVRPPPAGDDREHLVVDGAAHAGHTAVAGAKRANSCCFAAGRPGDTARGASCESAIGGWLRAPRYVPINYPSRHEHACPTEPSYGRGHRALEIVSHRVRLRVARLDRLRASSSPRTASATGSASRSPRLTGYIVSDFLSGFVHWAGDTVGDESTPIFGPNFVRPFRYHHVDPEDITRHDFIETNGNNCIVAAPVLLLVLLLHARRPPACCSTRAW